jgi:hypothetical protein
MDKSGLDDENCAKTNRFVSRLGWAFRLRQKKSPFAAGGFRGVRASTWLGAAPAPRGGRFEPTWHPQTS